MVASLVGHPVLKGITFRYLLAHAEKPALLRDSSVPALKRFAETVDGPSFYEEFVRLVSSTVPGYTEARLLDIESFVPQQEFVAVLNCFKRLSGIRNPFHFRELGRVIPTVGTGLTLLGATALHPAVVIRSSPRYNADFNNDQGIVVESVSEEGSVVNARVQHYLFPSTFPLYLEMVTAALGYWEGIPRLWKWPVLGKTNFFEVQIPLEDLVARDFAYLSMEYRENGKNVFINGRQVGHRVDLEKVLQYSPQERFLARPLEEHSPVYLDEDVIVDGEVILPAGTVFGMPCNRYDVQVPSPDAGTRLRFAVGRLVDTMMGKKSDYVFLAKPKKMIALSDQMRATQRAEISTLEARADAAEARTREVETQAAAQKLRGEISALSRELSAELELREQYRGLAHDIKGEATKTIATLLPDVRVYFQQDSSWAEQFGMPQDVVGYTGRDCNSYVDPIIGFLPKIVDNHSLDAKVQRDVRIVLSAVSQIKSAREIMGTETIKEEFEDIDIYEVVDQVVRDVRGMNQTPVTLEAAIPRDLRVRANRRQFVSCMTCLVDNAVYASSQGRVVITGNYESDQTHVCIEQTGELSPDVAKKLNVGQAESSRLEAGGNGIGARTSFLVVREHKGDLEFTSLGEQGGKTELWLYTQGLQH